MKEVDIQTGYFGLVSYPNLCTPEGLAEAFIALSTPSKSYSCFYHVMLFYRDDGGNLRVSEMVQPQWRDIPFADRLKDLDGRKLWIGKTPWVVSGQPQKVLDFITDWRNHPEWHPYGDSSLLATGISNDFKMPIDPFKMQPVCSLHCERCVLTIEQGDILELWSPNHAGEFCDSLELYEGGI
jgi:hypothetical protein